MSKVKLFKCYYCRRKSEKENMIAEEGRPTKSGGKTTRYFHEECKRVQMMNKKNRTTRTGIGNTEGEKHSQLKLDIRKFISKNKLVLVDQFENEIEVEGELVKYESPVVEEYVGKAPFNNNESCNNCFSKYEIDEGMYGKLRKRVCDLKEVKQGEHPCIRCPFNTLKYYYLFDVGIASNGIYTDVIEVLHSSRVKKGKLTYCIKNNINLFEVDTVEEIKDDKLKVNRLWWIDNNEKICIHDDYIDLF
jgi:hypothetical protein